MANIFESEPTLATTERDSTSLENNWLKSRAETDMAKLAIKTHLEATVESTTSIDKRVAELSIELGEKFSSQRPEVQRAIAELPIIGRELQKDENGQVADNGQEVAPENVVFVRSTNFLPSYDNGGRTVLTAFEATRNSSEPIYRLTTHWTANHVVHDHNMGQFEHRKFIIIAPGEGMLNANGAPESMLPVDTYWNRNVKLPENSIILAYENTEAAKGIINLEKEDDSEAIAILAIRAMGYSTVKDHPTYTESGFDKGVYNLGERLGITESRLHTDMETMATAIENFFHPSPGGEFAYSALERMAGNYWQDLPEEVKKAAIDSLVDLTSDKTPREEKDDIYSGLEDVLVDSDDKYALESRSGFITALPYEVLNDFVRSNSEYWGRQGESQSEMIDYYIDQLSRFIGKDLVERLRKDRQPVLNA